MQLNIPGLHLLDLRALKASDDTEIGRLGDGHYRRLSSRFAIPKRIYNDLAPWDRRIAEAWAVGATVRTAVVSGESAARFWGLDVRGVDHAVDLCLPSGRPPSRATWPRGVIYRCNVLPAADWEEVAGSIRVTSVARTIVDICRWYGLVDGLIALDSARRKRPAVPVDYWRDALLGVRRYPGKKLVHRVIELSVPNSGSALETWVRALLIEAGLGA